ncbi:MAG: roadblock/LC7 domain-containing protein [Candidatus Bathyarchaeales archaeon]
MPKTKSKLEKISQENIEIGLDEIKPKETHPQTQLTKKSVKETPAPTINTVLSELKSKEGIIGYILRNTRSASIDLNDPTKIIDYAVLSSSAIDTGDELAQMFDLGEIKRVIIEGKTAKLLSVTVDENNISVFMDKNVDHNQIYKILTHTA